MEDNLDAILRRLHLPSDALAGQVMLITGAGSGIGRGLARLAARAGATAVIAELSERGRSVEEEIRESGDRAVYIQCDVSDPLSVAALAAAVEQRFGAVDVLVNNAIVCPVGSVMEMNVEIWDRVMAVNLRGAFLTCHHFLPGMIKRGRGLVINMVSTDAMAHLSAYIASKQGLVGFSRSLDAEVGEQGVAVVALAPGFVDTPGLRSAADGLAPHMGLTSAEFMKLSFHDSQAAVEEYGGAMPPEHAAAAVLPLAVGLAREYHGQEINGYQILERVGFFQSSQTPEDGHASASDVNEAADQHVVEDGQDHRRAIMDGLVGLEKLLDETAREFDRLPFFVRPMARGGFQGKSGASLETWKTMCRDWLTASSTGQGLPNPAEASRKLEMLADYIREVPANTARFSSDAAFLDEVNRLAKLRLETLTQLQRALSRQD